MLDLTGVSKIDQTKSPLFQAFKRMEENTPPYPLELIESLGLSKDDVWAKSSKPNFRGWFGSIGKHFNLWDWMSIPAGVDLNDIGYVSIWRARSASKTHLLWCALPSMESGESKPGETFSLNTERVRIGWKKEDLDAMVKQGYEIIKAKIAEIGEYRENGQ